MKDEFQQLNEQDLHRLFSGDKKRSYLNPVTIVFLFIFLVLFFALLINFSAVKKKISFWFNTGVRNESYENPIIEKIVNNQAEPESIIQEVPENSIYIDRIDLTAPILFDIPNEEKAVEEGLQKGVIHIKDTAHPGEQGNVFITGHSSNFFWLPGNYKNVFSLLGNLDIKDNIIINFRGQLYFYKITDKFAIDPTEIGALKQSTKSELTLMTCYPVGTNLRRLIIKADQLLPDPKQNIKKRTTPLDFLPAVNR
jgi:LPXTG-site transpeptidase (sortase) family protein